MSALHDLLRRAVSPDDALAGGRVKLRGDSHALQRFIELFAFGQPERAEVAALP